MEFDIKDFSNTNAEMKSLAEIRRDSFSEGFVKGRKNMLKEVIEIIKSHSEDDKLMNSTYVEWIMQAWEE